MSRPVDGAGVRYGSQNFTVVVDHNEDGTSSWYECDGCDDTIHGGDDSLAAHECWFNEHDKLAAFVSWMAAEGYDATEVAYAVEKPWKYNDEAKEAGIAA